MSYQVIARKYRPQRFSDVVGQEHVTQTLANAIAQNRIAHAYLFCGPRGTGKTTIARIFAKCLNCTGGPKVDFDDNDPRCQEITEGRSIDVMEIDGASNNGVDQVRELRETCRYAPAAGKFKIYIIDEVHMLTLGAFNALLKTLEEPPEHVKFMFATTDPEKVLPTILSRCQRFDLRRIPVKLIVDHLAQIARAESVDIDSAALHAIARGADGGMRDAESALDQTISFCGNKIQEADILSMYGLTSQSQLLTLTSSIIAGNAEAALREFDQLAKNGKDLARLVSDLLSHFRNVLIFQVTKGDLGLLEITEDEASKLAAQSASISSDSLTRILEVISQCEGGLRDASSKKILIEVALLKAIQARNAMSIDAVLKQLQQLRTEGGASPAPAPRPAFAAPAPAPAPAPAMRTAAPAPTPQPPANIQPAAPLTLSSAPATPPVPTTTPAAVAPKLAPAPVIPLKVDVHQLWKQLVEAAGRANSYVLTIVQSAYPISFENNVFTIGLDPEFQETTEQLDTVKYHTLFHTKMGEMGYAHAQFKFVKAEPPTKSPATAPLAFAFDSASSSSSSVLRDAPPAPSAPAPPAKPKAKPATSALDPAEFKNDPLIKKALEIFKGQIVDIKT